MDQSVRLRKAITKDVQMELNASQMFVHRANASVKLHSKFYILENVQNKLFFSEKLNILLTKTYCT